MMQQYIKIITVSDIRNGKIGSNFVNSSTPSRKTSATTAVTLPNNELNSTETCAVRNVTIPNIIIIGTIGSKSVFAKSDTYDTVPNENS